MTRPIDETWRVDPEDPDMVIGTHSDCDGFPVAEIAGTAMAPARARLAAQAPAMARFIRDMLAYRTCEYCQQKVDRTVSDGQGGWLSTPDQHTPTCELIAVLRAAGVVD